MKKDKKSELLGTINHLSIKMLDDILKAITRTRYCDENEFKDIRTDTIYGLSTTIKTIEDKLKVLKKTSEQSIAEYRKINNLN